jgi:DNA processing protein
MTGKEVLVYLSTKYEGDWTKVKNAIRAREPLPFDAQKTPFEAPKCGVLTIIDDIYPNDFKNLQQPPFILYYYGDISLLGADKTKIGYVGSREASPYGLKMANLFGSEIAKRGYVLINGLARGIEATALTAALDAGGKVIAVLGSGIDLCYPSTSQGLYERIKKDGLVLSEYPLSTPPMASNFPMRNRIVAGLSKGLIVGEASRKSGALITVAYALAGDKDIGCVPYHADEDSACNMLIKEGAQLMEKGEDIDVLIGKTETKVELK